MPAKRPARLKFGPKKYMAYNLIVAKWLRTFALPAELYSYVTLGGTELYDIANLAWIDKLLVSHARSYEDRRTNFNLAQITAKEFADRGITVEVVEGDFFKYRRDLEGHHIFYIDLQGTCSLRQYLSLFEGWFRNEILQPGDLLLITSYLGRNRGWPKVLNNFQSDFNMLGVTSFAEMKRVYQLAHPLFVLDRALGEAGLHRELHLSSLGCIKYVSRKSPMGLYGIACEEGETNLVDFVNSEPWFDCGNDQWYIPIAN